MEAYAQEPMLIALAPKGIETDSLQQPFPLTPDMGPPNLLLPTSGPPAPEHVSISIRIARAVSDGEGGRFKRSMVVSGPPLASHRGIVGHRGSSPSDCHSSTRRVVTRVAGSTTAGRVGPRSAGTHRGRDKGRHRMASTIPIPSTVPRTVRCRYRSQPVGLPT